MEISKQDYLDKTKDFVDFLVDVISSTNQTIFQNGIKSNEKNLGCVFTTFEELAKSYNYDKKCLHETNEYLWENSLKYKDFLGNSFSSKFPFDSDLKSLNLEKNILGLCLEIMRWGGVNSPKFSTSFVNNNLSIHLRSAIDFFKKTKIDKNSFEIEIGDRMNASYSKVYSLCCEIPFIIFDSRVAAALRFLTAAFFIKNRSVVTEEMLDLIKFPRLGDRISKKGVTRDLSHIMTDIEFKTLNPTDTFLYAVWNIRVNWLIESVVENVKTFCDYDVTKSSKDKFCVYRSIEAGLFQLGYNLNDNAHIIKQLKAHVMPISSRL